MINDLFREGIRHVVILSAIPLVLAALLSVLVSILQAATQLQEQTSAFLLRLLTYGLALFLVAPAISRGAIRFTIICFQAASEAAKGG